MFFVETYHPLPRQALDKHKSDSTKAMVICTGSGELTSFGTEHAWFLCLID
jgi:hypothetical protein